MIELTFHDSVAGVLKYAKSMKHGEISLGGASVIIDESGCRPITPKPKKWQGLDMEGSPADVTSLFLALDIGNLSGNLPDRGDVLSMLFDDHFPGVSDGMMQINETALSRIRLAAKSGDKIRAWLSDTDPSELCGLYFLCDLLEGSKAELSVVWIPKSVEKEGTVINYRSTGEVDAEMYGSFVNLETALTLPERHAYALEWKRLINENSPLRVYLNGAVVSVPEDFYDFAIKENIPEGEFVCARLIGKTLIMIPGVGDRWLYKRIEKMINEGKLTEISPAPAEHPYMTVLKRSDKAL